MNPALISCLLGGASGDSVGLPSEGMTASRIARLRPGPLRQSLVFGRGMISDDTEHAVMTLLSLRDSGGDERKFAKHLARRLRWWLASVPAGIGLATARSIIKLWLGVRPTSSGVVSAGNGPLMRAPVIGLWFADDRPIAKHSSVPPRRSPIATHGLWRRHSSSREPPPLRLPDRWPGSKSSINLSGTWKVRKWRNASQSSGRISGINAACVSSPIRFPNGRDSFPVSHPTRRQWPSMHGSCTVGISE